MKTHVKLYSPSSESEEPDPFDPPKDPTFVDVRDLCVPLGDCATVKLGPVGASVCKWLTENRFDQAAAQVPSAEFGWRLVARTELERLATEGHPLTDDPAGFLPDDTCNVGMGYPSVGRLFEVLGAAPAVLAYGEIMSREIPLTGEELGAPHRSIEIFGLVTRSDLNKHPIRLAIYDCLARLERGLAHLVSAAFPDPWDWVQKVSPESQVRILGYMELSARRSVEHEAVAGAMLPDIFRVIGKTPTLLSKLGLASRGVFDESTGRLVDVRNRVMHPVRPLILGEEDVRSIGEVVKTAEDLSLRVRAALNDIAKRAAS